MSKKAIVEVVIDGQNITSRLLPLLISLNVSDKAGASSDTASLEIDDTDGRALMPRRKASVLIKLGWDGEGVGHVFQGHVSEVTCDGGRSGRTMQITATGMDTRGKAKQGQRRHFDDTTIKDALTGAGKTAGISVTVDPEFASIKRPYIALDDESFAEFGERIAREVGGTFKIVGDRAVLAKRNGGKNPAGAALAVVQAVWGQNLHSYSATPAFGRRQEKAAVTRWYDPREAEQKVERAETGTEDAETVFYDTLSGSDEGDAKARASSTATELDRNSGNGSVSIEGNLGAQPEGICELSGCRPGVDGTYRITSVNHVYSRSGWITRLDLGQPKGKAGKDDRESSAETG